MAPTPKTTETILINGLILANSDSPKVAPHGKTVIEGARLAAVNLPLEDDQESAAVIDCSNCLIMPGLVNAHTHAAMSLLRGIADDLPLNKWLNDYIFPTEVKYANPEFVYLGTCLSAVEMALAGTTTFADAYFHMEKSAAASIDVGMRAVIAQGILDVPSPDAPETGSWKDRVETFLGGCPKDSLITPALFCHSPYLCGPDTFRTAHKIADDNDLLLFSHVAETAGEIDDIKRRYSAKPVEHLNRLGVLGPDFVAVHAVHLSDAEKDILADTGTRVVHCPECNMKLASGAASVWDLMKKGITVAIGTDGAASNNNMDLFEEMRSASLLAKLVTGDPESLHAAAALKMATIDGAKALGLDDQIGTLTKGKLADLIVIDLNRPHLTPLYDPISHLVYSARGSDVRHVFVNGRQIVKDGRMTTIDETQLKLRVAAMAKRIGKDLGLTDYGAYIQNG
jgi:5-methylthioadenosine/S-adenosylhomocysteine deaminase